MASGSIDVKVGGQLQAHIQQQIGEDGRALVRPDLQTMDAAWESLQNALAPAMRADDSDFVTVLAEDVIRRNKRR